MKNNNKKTSFLGSLKNMFNVRKSNEVMNNLEEEEILTPMRVIVRNFFANKLAIVGIVLFTAICVFSFAGNAYYDVSLTYTESTLRNISPGTGYLSVPSELEENGIVDIQSGVSFSVGLDEQGNIYTWGVSTNESLDLPEGTLERKYSQIAVGDRHVLALGEDGEIYGWGYNSFSQSEVNFELEQDLRGKEIEQIYASEAYSAVLTTDNEVYAWGSVLSSKVDKIPADIQGKIIDVTCATYNMLLLLDDGTVASVGVTGSDVAQIPTELTDGSVNVVDVTMSYRNGLALDDEGNIHVWGSQTHGLLKVPEIEGEVLQIASGKNSLFVATDEDIYAWGDNSLGELDAPTVENLDTLFAGYFQMYAVNTSGEVATWGNNGFLFGTDEFGRDLLKRLMSGGTVTLSVGVIAAVISTFLGLLIGMLSGFIGGKVDNLLMRFGEIIMSIPFMPIVITLSSIVGSEVSPSTRINMIMVILGLLSWPGLARLVRGQILVEREKDFVLAARALGVKEVNIVISHVLPNVVSICIVNMTLSYAGFMLTESGLSYLGFGVANPQASWGNMLNSVTNSEAIENYWWRWVLPAMCVVIAAIGINFIGTALSDAIDPKANEK